MDTLIYYQTCTLELYGRTFKSAEHAFQYRRAYGHGRDDLTEKIIEAKHAGIAKKLTKELHTDGNISQNEIEIMECVIIEKAEQNPRV